MFVTRINLALFACGLVAGGVVVAAQQAGRGVEGLRPQPAPARSAGPAAARSDPTEEDAAAVEKATAEAELDLLDDEVRLLRKRVGEALETASDLGRRVAMKDTSIDKASASRAEVEYEHARRNYLEEARELARRRQRLGPRPGVPLLPLGDIPVMEEREAKRTAAPPDGHAHGPAAAIGSIDMDAVVKRSRMSRSLHDRLRAEGAEMKRGMAKLQEEREALTEHIRRIQPGTADHRALEMEEARLGAQIESELEGFNRAFERRQAQKGAKLFGEIREVIAAVARTKGLDYVVRIEATPRPDADPSSLHDALKRSVLYANPHNDITEEVIGELNRRFEAEGGDHGSRG